MRFSHYHFLNLPREVSTELNVHLQRQYRVLHSILGSQRRLQVWPPCHMRNELLLHFTCGHRELNLQLRTRQINPSPWKENYRRQQSSAWVSHMPRAPSVFPGCLCGSSSSVLARGSTCHPGCVHGSSSSVCPRGACVSEPCVLAIGVDRHDQLQNCKARGCARHSKGSKHRARAQQTFGLSFSWILSYTVNYYRVFVAQLYILITKMWLLLFWLFNRPQTSGRNRLLKYFFTRQTCFHTHWKNSMSVLISQPE